MKPPLGPLHFVFTTTLEGHWGGCEWLWADTALELRRRGHRVAVALPWLKGHPAIAALLDAGATLHTAQGQRRFWRRWARRLHARTDPPPLSEALLAASPVDLVVLSQDRHDKGAEFLAVLEHRAFVVVNQLVAEHIYWEDKPAEQIARLFRAARASYFVAPNNLLSLERILGESLPRASIVRNPYRVPYDQPLPLNARSPAMLSLVGRLDPDQKGHDILFDVLARPTWLARDWVLECYGSGSAANRLRHRIEQLGLGERVHFRGHVNDIPALWAAVDVALFPSRCEGTPIALVEAMLSGRPALVTDVGGNADFALDGRTGWVAPALHPDLLDAALQRTWQDRAHWPAMGAAAAAHARSLVPPDPASAWANELERIARVP